MGDRSLGDLISEITQDLSTLVRQELELAKAELAADQLPGPVRARACSAAPPSPGTSCCCSSRSRCGGPSAPATGLGWSAVIVAVIWAIVAAVLVAMGRASLRAVRGLPRTADSVKKIPDALKGNE